MITKGVIKTINYSNNTCTVRIPLFETAGSSGEVVFTATFMIQPGIYNGYSEEDVVFVDFEDNKLSYPIIIGKLFKGATTELANEKLSSITASSLQVSKDATIPLTTKLSFSNPDTTRVKVDRDYSNYKTLLDIIKAIKDTDDSIENLTKDVSSQISEIKTYYLEQADSEDLPDPIAEDSRWSITKPSFKDGFEIWQKTVCYNNRGQVLSTEIICLTEVSSIVSYWLNINSSTFTGKTQATDITIEALAKVGSKVETKDTTSILKVFKATDSTTLIKTGTEGFLRLTKDDLRDYSEDLLVVAYHKTGTTEREYYSTTIKYMPLNTPILTLTNYSGSLDYDSYGFNKLNLRSTISSTAEVKLNNEELPGVQYAWTLDGCEQEGSSLTTKTITIKSINDDHDYATATCTATYVQAGESYKLTAEFRIIKNRAGVNYYEVDIDNPFVSIAATSTRAVNSDTLKLLTEHELTCSYQGDALSFNVYNSLPTNINNSQYYIVYNSNNINLSLEDDQETPNTKKIITVTSFTTDDAIEGTINYILYKGSTKIASETFRVQKLIQGNSAINYELKMSKPVHTGINQQEPITITGWMRTGNEAYVQNNSLYIQALWKTNKTDNNGNYIYELDPTTSYNGSLTISTFRDADLRIQTSMTGDFEDEDIEDDEIITFNPLNTPVLDLSNDNDELEYKSTGDSKVNPDATVSCFGVVYYNGQILTEDVTYDWIFEAQSGDKENTYVLNNEIQLEDSEGAAKITGNRIIASEAGVFTCRATIKNAIFTNQIILTKDFTVSKNLQGHSAIKYWLKLSSGTHLGTEQLTPITVTAMQKIGSEGGEDTDELAILWYKFEKDALWTMAPETVSGDDKRYYTFTLEKEYFKDENIQVIATHKHKDDFNPNTIPIPDVNNSPDVYDQEVIDFSPKNSPIISLTEDGGQLNYTSDGNTKIGDDVVQTTAQVLVGGKVLDDDSVTYNWTLSDCTYRDSSDAQSGATVHIDKINSNTTAATATCIATITEGEFEGKTYQKTFRVTKNLQGESAVSYYLTLDNKSTIFVEDRDADATTIVTGTCYNVVGTKTAPYGGDDCELSYKINGTNAGTGEIKSDGTFNLGEQTFRDLEVILTVKGNKWDSKTIDVNYIPKDGTDAISPYAIDIFNANVTALSNKSTLPGYDWNTNTEHRIKVLQGTTPIKASTITVEPANEYEPDIADSLILTYELNNIANITPGTNTEYEKIYSITGLINEDLLKGEINYLLYDHGVVVATATFKFLTILYGVDGVSIISVTNMYYATANADANTENPADDGEKLPAIDEKDDQGNTKWKDKISDTDYGETKPYLWNYEIISYSSGNPTTTPIALLGSRGKGIKALSEYYLLTATATTPNKPENGNEGDWKTIQNGGPTQPTATNPYLWNVEKVEYTDGDVEFTNPALIGTYSRSITEVKNYYLATTSDTAILPNKGNAAWKPTITETGFNAINKYLWNYEEIFYDRALTAGGSDNSKTTTPEIISTWSKEIKEIKEFYLISKSMDSGNFEEDTNKEANWAETLKTPKSTYPYLWNKETTYYTDGTEDSTNPIILSTFARSIIGIKNYYLATTSDYSSKEEQANKPTHSTTGWEESINAAEFGPVNKYLWNYEEITYDLPLSTGETTSKTDPEIISTWSKSIDKIEEYYLISKSNDDADFDSDTNRETDWSLTAVAPNSSYPYLWNKEIIHFTDGTSEATDPVIIGTYGETFGVNIIPSASSVIATEIVNGDTSSWTYSPPTITVRFTEVAGDTVIDCGDSQKRKYRYKIYVNNDTTPRDTVELTPVDKTADITLSSTGDRVQGYRIELELQQTTWINVGTQSISVAYNGKDGKDGVDGEDGVDGADAVYYWIKGVEAVHTGDRQTDTISVTAMKRIGNAPEQVDSGTNGAVIWYNNNGTWKSRLGGSNEANCHTLIFNKGEFYNDFDLKLILTHDKSWTPPSDVTATNSKVEDWEVITYSPLNSPILSLTNDSASLVYTANNKKKTDSDTVSSTAEVYLNGSKITDGVTYSWSLSDCKDSNGTTTGNAATITIKDLLQNSATATCVATYKSQTYTKIFTITKQFQGEDGNDGSSIEAQHAFYWVDDYLATPSVPEDPPTETWDDFEDTDKTWAILDNNNYPTKEKMKNTNWCLVFYSSRTKTTDNNGISYSAWTLPTPYLINNEDAYRILTTAEGLFGYGQGVYYTPAPERDENGKIVGDKEITLDDGTKYKTGEKIPQNVATEYVAANPGERKDDLELYIDAEYIRTGMLTVGKDTNEDGTLQESEIFFQAGYEEKKDEKGNVVLDENKKPMLEPKVKIGGFTVDSNSFEGGNAVWNSNIGFAIHKIETEADFATIIPCENTSSNDQNGAFDILYYVEEWDKTNHLEYEKNYYKYNITSNNEDGTLQSKYIILKVTKNLPIESVFYLGIQNSLYAEDNKLDYIFCSRLSKDEANNYIPGNNVDTLKVLDSDGNVIPANSIKTQTRYTLSGLENLVRVSCLNLVEGEVLLVGFVSRNKTKMEESVLDNYGNIIVTGNTESKTSAFVLLPEYLSIPKTALEIGPNFKISVDGKINARDAVLGGSITAPVGGNIGGINIQNNSISSKNMFTLNKQGLYLNDFNRLKFGPEKELEMFVTDTVEQNRTSYVRSFSPLKIQSINSNIFEVEDGTYETNLSDYSSSILISPGAFNSYSQILKIKYTEGSISKVTNNYVPDGPVTTVSMDGEDTEGYSAPRQSRAIVNNSSSSVQTDPTDPGGGLGGGANIPSYNDRWENWTPAFTTKTQDYLITFTLQLTKITTLEDSTISRLLQDHTLSLYVYYKIPGSGFIPGIIKKIPVAWYLFKGTVSSITEQIKTQVSIDYSEDTAPTLEFVGIGLSSDGGYVGKNVELESKEIKTIIYTGDPEITINTKKLSIPKGNLEITEGNLNIPEGNLNIPEGSVYAVSYNASSDRRLKSDIKELDSNYNDLFDSLKPVEYKFNTELDKTRLGFIAQDINESCENLGYNNLGLVSKNINDYYNINYLEIIALNTLQIKQLKQQVEELKQQIIELKK